MPKKKVVKKKTVKKRPVKKDLFGRKKRIDKYLDSL